MCARASTRITAEWGGSRKSSWISFIGSSIPRRELDVSALVDGLDSLETDLPLDELFTLMELARRAGDAEVDELVIRPPLITFEGDRDDGRGYILEMDVEAIRAEVQEMIGD